MGVINVEVIGQTLDDEPGFVSRNNRACAVEFLDVKCACLSPRGSIGNLNGNERKFIRMIGEIRMSFEIS